MLSAFPQLGGADTAAHHCGFLLASLVAGTLRAFPFAFGWLILCEASTPLLNLRWLVRSAGPLGGASPQALQRAAAALGAASLAEVEARVGVAFFGVFVATRVVGYGVGVVHLGLALRAGRLSGLPRAPVAAMVACILAGWGLNLSWMGRLLSHAGARRRKAA